MSNEESNEENNGVNAKEIAEKWVSGIKWRPSLVEVKEVVFISEKSVHLSRLRALFLGTQRW